MKIIKVRELKKYIISLKKYIIGFILGLSLIGGLTYAADSGSIGALFEKIDSIWYLKNVAVKDNTLSGSKIVDGTIGGSKIAINSITNDKIQGGVISEDKLNDDLKGKLNSSINNTDISVNNIDVGNNLNIAGDGFIDGTLYPNSLYINGEYLKKKIKIIDNSWYTIINPGQIVGHGKWYNHYFTVPAGEYIAKMRLSGGVDDGGVCGVFVNGKLGFAVSKSYDMTGPLTTEGFGTIKYNYRGWGDFTSRILDITLLSGTNYMGPLDNDNYGYIIKGGVEYLKGGDQINMKQYYKDVGGGSRIKCKLEVQYGELSY